MVVLRHGVSNCRSLANKRLPHYTCSTPPQRPINGEMRKSLGLRAHTLIVLCVVVLGIFSSIFIFALEVINPSFATLESDSARKDAGRVLALIEQHRYASDIMCADWARWDDMYHYVLTPSDAFYQSNLTEEAAGTLRMDLLIIFDAHGRWREGHFYNDTQVLATPLQTSLNMTGPLHTALVDKLLKDTESQGKLLIEINGFALLLVARPIVQSDGSGPTAGVLVMGSLFSEAIIKRLTAVGGIGFSIETGTQVTQRLTQMGASAELSSAIHDDLDMGQGHIHQYIAENTIYLWAKVSSPGSASLFVWVERPRTLTEQVSRNLMYAITLMLAYMMILAGLLYYLMSKKVIAPLYQVVNTVQAVEENASTTKRLDVAGSAEFRLLMSSFNQMLDELQQQRSAIEQLSLTDELTSLPNRRQFDSVWAREWQHACRNKNSLCVMLLDIDEFKKYNDHFGHQQGDLCLREIAETLVGSLKRVTDFVARWGGEEFVIVLPNTGKSGAVATAERILSDVRDRLITHPKSTVSKVVTISIGICTGTPTDKDSPKQWLDKADQALYEAKHLGRDQYCLLKPN